MKYIREGRMGPPFSFKTGAVVGTYPKPMLVFLFDEEGLSVIPSRNVPSVPGNIPLDCVYEDITRIKPSEIGDYLLKEPPTKITAVDFCDTIDKQMTTDLVPVKNRAPFDSFATMLNKIVTHDNQGQALYQALTTSGSMMLLSATTSNSFTGIALNNAAAGQPVSYVVYDPNFTTGATHNIGDVICTSTNAGYLCPAADVTGTTHHGNFVTVLGVATSASTVFLNPTASGTSSP